MLENFKNFLEIHQLKIFHPKIIIFIITLLNPFFAIARNKSLTVIELGTIFPYFMQF